MPSTTTLMKRTLAAATCLVLPAVTHAGNGLLPAGNGIAAYGRGGAGLAGGSDASASVDNPALMHQTGQSLAIGFSLVKQQRELDMTNVAFDGLPFVGRRVPSDDEITSLPQFAYTGAAIGALHWGVQLYDMGGLNGQFRTGPVPEIRPEPQAVDLRGRIVGGSLSWSPAPQWALGGSLLGVHQTLLTRNLLSTKALGSGQETSVGYGVKLGATWQPTETVTLGATFQPRIKMSKIDYLAKFMAAFGYTGHAAISMPTQVGAGVKFALGPRQQTLVLADVMHYAWSKEGFYNFFGWKDQTVLKLGVEHQLSEQLTLRAGLNYGKSPIRGGSRTGNDGDFVPQTGAEVPLDPNAPRGDGKLDAAFGNYPYVSAISQTHVTLGLGYRMSRDLTLNSFMMYSPRHVEVATGPSLTPGGMLPAGSDIKMKQFAVGVGVNYTFK